MCGIVGGIGFKTWETDKILSNISHRGPDSQGSFNEDAVFLGHTRLSIQDLSENGNQPMFSTDYRYVIIFNGEIYNHLEIRAKFQNDFVFRSTGDTETVMNAYIKYGISCLNMFNGIFAFVIYDRETKEIVIARDQMGVKPLYIYHDETCFLFSSEIKSFLNFDIDKKIDPEALANYLTFLWSPGVKTPFSRVHKLLPGHYLRFSVGNKIPEPVKYYKEVFTGNYLQESEEVLIDMLEDQMVNAVKRQMLSDVPVGFFLSGGLDSSLIVAIAKRLFPDSKFPCFTIEIEGWSEKLEDFTDDMYYAKKVAEYLDVELHVVKANIDIVNDFDKMIWHLDEPQADPAPLNVLNIASLAHSKGIKVLLGGTGGDDLFSGYRRHQALRYEKYFRLIPNLFGRMISSFTAALPLNTTFLRRLKKITANLGKSTDERMSDYFNWLPDKNMRALFTNKWQEKIRNYNPSSYLTNLNNEIPNESNLLNRMLYWEIKSFLVDHNLNYTDKMAMAVGVEARVPFLDLELVEFSMKIPPTLKMKDGETKYILKKLAERYLPHDVIYRPKTGFGAPVRKWIISDMEEMINERLSYNRITEMGIFDYDKVWQLIRDNKSGKIDASYSVWAILAIDSWMEQFYNKVGNSYGK